MLHFWDWYLLKSTCLEKIKILEPKVEVHLSQDGYFSVERKTWTTYACYTAYLLQNVGVSKN